MSYLIQFDFLVFINPKYLGCNTCDTTSTKVSGLAIVSNKLLSKTP